MTAPSDTPRLADLTTLRVGGPVTGGVHDVTTEAEFIDAVRTLDEAGTPLLVLGGGSNLLVADAGFEGGVVRDRRTTIEGGYDGACAGASVTVSAGTVWDDLVVAAVDNEWMGVEALSGIPGTVGAAPVQNVGAYGQEVAETIAAVRVWDRLEARARLLPLASLGFGYRTSVLKRSLTSADEGGGRTWGPTGRYVVLDVTFQMRGASLSAPIRYAELARRLDVSVGDRVPARDVRAAVLELRAGKGMVLDADDHDTWSAGSFFTNPILTDEQAADLPADAPRFPVADTGARTNIADAPRQVEGLVKTSAAWLIDHAGFGKGFAVDVPAGSGDAGDVGDAGDAVGGAARARLSTKHVLALTNRGGADAADLVALARAVRDGVRDAFGVTLEPEPVLVGVSL